LPKETIAIMLQQSDEGSKRPAGASRSSLRSQGMTFLTGGRGSVRSPRPTVLDANASQLSFGFAQASHTILECAGTMKLTVAASCDHSYDIDLRYTTIEGTAKAGARFVHTEGTLHFGPNQMEKTIEVQILDNSTWEEEEEFVVELFDLAVSQQGGSSSSSAVPQISTAQATVTVLNDDLPAIISFATQEIYTSEGQTLVLQVTRSQNCAGESTVHYRTQSGSAMEKKDFTAIEGTLVFQDGQTHQLLEVQILHSHGVVCERNEKFKVRLEKASVGAKFDPETDGGAEAALCEVIIQGNTQPSALQRLYLRWCNEDRLKEGMRHWAAQFQDALYCNGSAEAQASATQTEWFFHCLCLFWKLLFAFVPPPIFFGGWLCFWIALGMIGFVTAIVGDMASLLGCCIGIPDDITAITLVALGTSLPDTFASKVAAQQEDTADNSIGNITGSNCVNVFLGLGLPWTIAACYWSAAGMNEDWLNRDYKGSIFKDLYTERYPKGGFIVPAASLGFSVTVFTVCALLCLLLLFFRRVTYGGELGGPKPAQTRDSVILSSLWLLYIIASITYSLTSS